MRQIIALQEEPCWQTIILAHQAKYPLSQVQDWLKLTYQHVFAGDHMIDNAESSLRFLKVEMEALKASSTVKTYQLSDSAKYVCDQDKHACDSIVGADSAIRYRSNRLNLEAIGHGLVRVHLQHLPADSLYPETLNSLFVGASKLVQGNVPQLEEKLVVLRAASQNEDIAVSVSEMNRVLRDYKDKHYPSMHHSQIYRENYKPAYRLARKCDTDFFELHREINKLLQKNKTSYVALDGDCGSGKSTLADALAQVYGDQIQIIRMDDFFPQPYQRTAERLAEPGGNIDYERFECDIIQPLKQKALSSYQKFDCQTMQMGEIVPIKPAKIYVIEGSYSQHPAFSSLYDLKVFLSIDQHLQFDRIRQRSGDALLDKFVKIWIPMEKKYFEAFDIEKQADLVYNIESAEK